MLVVPDLNSLSCKFRDLERRDRDRDRDRSERGDRDKDRDRDHDRQRDRDRDHGRDRDRERRSERGRERERDRDRDRDRTNGIPDAARGRWRYRREVTMVSDREKPPPVDWGLASIEFKYRHRLPV